MARPREFDEDEVLEKALAVFWAKGFEGATVDDLEQATGLGRGSLYGAFGGKHELFLEGFRPLRGRWGWQMSFGAAGGRAGRDHHLLPRGRPRGAGRPRPARLHGHQLRGRACGRGHPGGGPCRRHLDRLERGFEAAVREAQARGEIAAGRDPVRVARFLTVCLQGMQVLARARPDAAWLEDVVAAVDEALG